jgi:hypothetical protein
MIVLLRPYVYPIAKQFIIEEKITQPLGKDALTVLQTL